QRRAAVLASFEKTAARLQRKRLPEAGPAGHTAESPPKILRGTAMGNALDVHRLHFAFTVTYHYLFPQLTMGKALRTGDEHYNKAARFWARIFGINFAIGVVTGIPMEFQFGTNWAEFSKAAGGVIGQT